MTVIDEFLPAAMTEEELEAMWTPRSPRPGRPR